MSLNLPGILLDSHWLHAHLEHPQLLILDATVELPAPRFDGDYRASSGYEGWRQAHIPGARHADLLTDLADSDASFSFALPTPAELLAALAALGVAEHKRVVIYDRTEGFWAARLWWMLRSVGIEAAVLDGGFKAWLQAHLPIQQNHPAASPASVIPAQTGIQNGPANEDTCKILHPSLRRDDGAVFNNSLWASRSEVEAMVAGLAPGTLICALGTALFDGTAASRYARRGHIPGSQNLPARTLFDEQGRYLPKDVLAQVLAAYLHDETPLILYCGGGISAAANALALTLLGRQHIAIYDGSLQEWAADARLPMTTGAPPA
ncbi:thiosulfate/3-mercaptopyruvate sulfurtransferase [Pseudomonas sp. TE3786]